MVELKRVVVDVAGEEEEEEEEKMVCLLVDDELELGVVLEEPGPVLLPVVEDRLVAFKDRGPGEVAETEDEEGKRLVGFVEGHEVEELEGGKGKREVLVLELVESKEVLGLELGNPVAAEDWLELGLGLELELRLELGFSKKTLEVENEPEELVDLLNFSLAAGAVADEDAGGVPDVADVGLPDEAVGGVPEELVSVSDQSAKASDAGEAVGFFLENRQNSVEKN